MPKGLTGGQFGSAGLLDLGADLYVFQFRHRSAFVNLLYPCPSVLGLVELCLSGVVGAAYRLGFDLGHELVLAYLLALPDGQGGNGS